MLLIHQGTTPLPGSDEWESLSEDEQKAVYRPATPTSARWR